MVGWEVRFRRSTRRARGVAVVPFGGAPAPYVPYGAPSRGLKEVAMKRYLILIAIAAALVAPAFAADEKEEPSNGWRLDIGVDIPKGVGAFMAGDVNVSGDVADFLSQYFFPFPEAALHYQFDTGMFRFGVGLRGFTFIIESVVWPNVFAEAELGPVVLEAQAGGGLFGAFGIGNTVQTGSVFFPDLSAWFKIGKSFRLGGGAIGVFLPEQSTNTIPFAFYFGGKAAIRL